MLLNELIYLAILLIIIVNNPLNNQLECYIKISTIFSYNKFTAQIFSIIQIDVDQGD
jgi:hypothetical protein